MPNLFSRFSAPAPAPVVLPPAHGPAATAPGPSSRTAQLPSWLAGDGSAPRRFLVASNGTKVPLPPKPSRQERRHSWLAQHTSGRGLAKLAGWSVATALAGCGIYHIVAMVLPHGAQAATTGTAAAASTTAAAVGAQGLPVAAAIGIAVGVTLFVAVVGFMAFKALKRTHLRARAQQDALANARTQQAAQSLRQGLNAAAATAN